MNLLLTPMRVRELYSTAQPVINYGQWVSRGAGRACILYSQYMTLGGSEILSYVSFTFHPNLEKQLFSVDFIVTAFCQINKTDAIF